MKTSKQLTQSNERGMALITALLAVTLLLALGIAVVSSATNDNVTTKMQRSGQQSFFVADAGLSIARRAITQAFAEEIEKIRNGQQPFHRKNAAPGPNRFPDVQVVPDPDQVDQDVNPFFANILTRANALASEATRDQKFKDRNGTSFTVRFFDFTGRVSFAEISATQATESFNFRYAIEVTGAKDTGGSSSVRETGKLSANINLVSEAFDPNRAFKFSGFGAFFDFGDTNPDAALAAGIFSGPVHTNTHFAFLSSRSVTFRNVVSQVDNKIRYDNMGTTTPNRNIPTGNITGITISAEGYKKADYVPLPENNFSQEYAVINSTGVTDLRVDGSPVDPPGIVPTDGSGNPLPVFDAGGRVNVNVLAANLRNISNTSPVPSGGKLPTGVYISATTDPATSTNIISGAGIFVQGDASDIQVKAETNGDQSYIIKQGSTTTTIRSNYASNTTTMNVGSTTRTYSGVFKDKSDPANIRNGASLFVNGSILSLRGGKDTSATRPAIASQTALTITAQRHITITGDLKYTNAVADNNGSAVANINSIKNVFGIFTNDGNVKMEPNTSYVSTGRSLEINAAVVSFNANTANDGSTIEGSITYTGATLDSADRLRLVGSRVQSKINNIGYNYRDVFFDVRYSGGTFAPPFFPGTSYSLVPPPPATEVAIGGVDAPAVAAMSWFRQLR